MSPRDDVTTDLYCSKLDRRSRHVALVSSSTTGSHGLTPVNAWAFIRKRGKAAFCYLSRLFSTMKLASCFPKMTVNILGAHITSVRIPIS